LTPKEQQQLQGWLATRDKSALDQYGGWNKGPAFDASEKKFKKCHGA
jgi:hypothetical protein